MYLVSKILCYPGARSLFGAVQHYLEQLSLFIAVLGFDQSLPEQHVSAASLVLLGT